MCCLPLASDSESERCAAHSRGGNAFLLSGRRRTTGDTVSPFTFHRMPSLASLPSPCPSAGDITPQTALGRMFTVLFLVAAVVYAGKLDRMITVMLTATSRSVIAGGYRRHAHCCTLHVVAQAPLHPDFCLPYGRL